MRIKRRILVACTSIALSLGAATATPAAAENASAHQRSKMMRHKPMTTMGMHHRGRMMMHRKRMMHHRSM